MPHESNRRISGTIPMQDDNTFILISNHKGNYIFPKGGIKKGENEKQAAARETFEEAGLKGDIQDKCYRGSNGAFYFIMKVTAMVGNFMESETRKRIILSYENIRDHEHVPRYVKELAKLVIDGE